MSNQEMNQMQAKLNKFSFLGSSIILVGLFLFGPKYFINLKSLIHIDGKLEMAEVKYITVRGGIKSELRIKLENQNSTYTIFKNIGNQLKNRKFEEMKNKLLKSKSVRIWINNSNQNNLNPDVYQIASNRYDIIYSIKDSKERSKNGLIGSTVIGALMIILSLTRFADSKNKTTKGLSVPKYLLTFLTLGLVFIFGFLAVLSFTVEVNEMGYFFGGLSLIYIMVIIYFNMKLKET